MNVTEVLGQARDTMSVKRVFGEPIEKNGVIVIPVARVMGGAGGGSGELPAANEAAAESPDELGASVRTAATSSGMGFGVMAGPAGAYVIKGDQVRWEPAVNIERMTAIGGFIGICALLILRSTVRSVIKR